MDIDHIRQGQSRILIRMGVLLILLGLITGLLVSNLANPRMALASHIEGVLSGMLLVILGLTWPRLNLGGGTLRAAAVLLVYGAYANWVNPLLGAFWSAGSYIMPMAGQGHKGTPIQEFVIGVLAVTLALSLLAGIIIVLVGLRGRCGNV